MQQLSALIELAEVHIAEAQVVEKIGIIGILAEDGGVPGPGPQTVCIHFAPFRRFLCDCSDDAYKKEKGFNILNTGSGYPDAFYHRIEYF